jgi:hypothetical protein
MTEAEVRARIAAVPRWYHPIEVRPGIVTPGANEAGAVLRALELPADCRGMRALDLGTRDGYFAFELERRGAEVVAVVVRNLTAKRMYLETLVMDFGGAMDELPLMRFFAGASWAGDPTNYWGPNVRCVEEMLAETEFTSRLVMRSGDRATFACEATSSPEAAYYLQIATGRRERERTGS